MGEKLLFKEWLYARYMNDSTYFGDLAKDVAADADFPAEGSEDDFISYIEGQGAGEEAVHVLHEVFSIFSSGEDTIQM